MPSSVLTTGRARRLPVIAVVLATVLSAACSQAPEDEPAASPTPDPTPTSTTDPDASPSPSPSPSDGGTDVDELAFTGCEADRYSVGYPQDWNTNDDSGLLGPCEIFHPGEIEEPQQPRGFGRQYAVVLYVDEVGYDEIDPGDSPDEVLEQRTATVDGRRARAVETRSTGQGATPEGERTSTWTVDLDGEILVATTSTVGDTDYDRDKQVLDRMVTQELTIDDGPDMIDGPSTTERSTQEPDGSVVLTDVRVGAHDSFDRLVLEVTGDGQAGWLIEYDRDPRSQGRGDPVDIEGDAVLRVALRNVPYPAAAPVEPYDGPQRIRPERTDAIVEVVQDVLFEGYQDFFVGLDERRPYRVERLTDPQRIVIDIETD